ncbi:hypothetical protein M948_17505 [Virgibacillus sp. CM-4]|uniref:sensor histidine kinase n=1 Tax=Virgibacillus sp. CM-4 TaxID=1354277 RepID=UPI0003886B80|nr:sensor histidine kinase [Virgibacillus sp. CM-4]EQB34905.1 hypothetical protein M948_17505 [Virgibacillus sp. CM-4]
MLRKLKETIEQGLHVSMQTKILGLIISLLVFIIALISTIFGIMELREEIEKAENSAEQTAKTLSYMPVIQDYATAIERDTKPKLKGIADQVREEINATGIMIEDRNGLIFHNVSTSIVSQLSKSDETYQAIMFGSAYTKMLGEGEEELLLGIAPIYVDYGSYIKVEGAISVIFQMKEIKADIITDIRNILIISLIVLAGGCFGGVMLARSIRKDTFGLEPAEIAALYKERGAILQSVKEGILAIDSNDQITMLNMSAKQMLSIDLYKKGIPLDAVFSSNNVIELLTSAHENHDVELEFNGKTIILNSQPIIDGNKKVGTVASFRDKTEIKDMVNTLSEVKRYSDDLRAQTHEFSNKLYVLLGLIELGRLDEAISFIKQEVEIQEFNTDIIFNQIEDEKIQAILLGKLAKASESRVSLTIDTNSSLSPLPEYYGLHPLLIILSNLIDNGFEAVSHVNNGEVTFFVTDIGKDIIFEVADNGGGIDQDKLPMLFKKGVSEKGKQRGYGLSNVKDEVEQLGGTIEIETSVDSGTVFTVSLPKNQK